MQEPTKRRGAFGLAVAAVRSRVIDVPTSMLKFDDELPRAPRLLASSPVQKAAIRGQKFILYWICNLIQYSKAAHSP